VTSIRAFLILVMLAALVLVIFTATFQGYRSGSDETASLLDRLLEEKISLLSGESAVTDGTTQSHQLYQVFSPSGALKKASAQAPETPLVIATDTLVNVSYNGSLWRALSQKTSSGETIVVAERVVDRYAISDNIISKALVPILLSMPVLALLIWSIVSFGLRHLKLLESELRDRSPQNMTALAIDSPPDELVPVIASTNSLLHRLRSAFER
jgi:two-component system sensor histidine kinase QseC